MGVKNKQRRAAKKKARRQDRPAGPDRAWDPFVPDVTAWAARAAVVDALGHLADDPGAAGRHADRLSRPDGPVPPSLVRQALSELLSELVAGVVARGWRPGDLAEISARRLGERHLLQLIVLLAEHSHRHSPARVAPAWRAELDGLGSGTAVEMTAAAGLQVALELAACLAVLPPISVLVPPPGSSVSQGPAARGQDVKVLARVRSLLAKAESTTFPEEAELLSAKAQQLVSRHALERLLAETDGRQGPSEPATAQRIWIEPPYVFAKAMLIAAVADANGCRAVLSEDLGFSTVIGHEGDLASVDLIVTSLLVQANGAMLRAGRQTDGRGTSRTRSFRQSFLVAYAGRIGERLRAATDDAVAGTGRSGELVPVLRDRAEQVDAAVDAMFPRQIARQARIGNAKGWAAGRAAADLALLDTDLQVTAAAG